MRQYLNFLQVSVQANSLIAATDTVQDEAIAEIKFMVFR